MNKQFIVPAYMKKRLFFDMDNVLVDFQSGLDKIDDETKSL